MSQRRNDGICFRNLRCCPFVGEVLLTDGAIPIGNVAGFCAIRRNSSCCGQSMACCRYGFLCFKDLVADGAVGAFRQAILRTGRRNCSVNHSSMSQRSNDGIRFRNFRCCPFVGEILLTDGAIPIGNVAGFRTIRRNSSRRGQSVTLCGNCGTDGNQGIADSTIGVAGIAFFGAGRFACIANLGCRMLAKRGGINKTNVIDACFFALIAVLLCIAESKAHTILAVESGNFDLRMAGLIHAIVVFKSACIPNCCPCFSTVHRGFNGQRNRSVIKIIAAENIIEFQSRTNVGKIDRRSNQKFILLRCVGPVFIVVDDQSNLCVIQVAKATLLPSITAGAERLHAPTAGREVGIFKIIFKEHTRRLRRNLKGSGNRVCSCYLRKGVGSDCTDTDAINQDIRNGKACHRCNGKGLILTFRNIDSAARCNDTTLTGCRGNLRLSRNIGIHAGCFKLDVINSSDAGIIARRSCIVPCERDIAHAKLRRKRNKSAVSNDIPCERIC